MSHLHLPFLLVLATLVFCHPFDYWMKCPETHEQQKEFLGQHLLKLSQFLDQPRLLIPVVVEHCKFSTNHEGVRTKMEVTLTPSNCSMSLFANVNHCTKNRDHRDRITVKIISYKATYDAARLISFVLEDERVL
ncbi:hypothetical protein L596_013623 [Steinernema carpocapsae]|uniref:ZP domain-containing protein n=1 Tax=Steinernema carpocapsae TaxID=34508 RepID=A0A4V6A584_STECR|nr:hypothetical protein L596_013623 [Steinernema carpocapsae]